MGLSFKKKKRLKIFKKRLRCKKKIFKLRRKVRINERNFLRQVFKSFIKFNFYLNLLRLNKNDFDYYDLIEELDFFNYDFKYYDFSSDDENYYRKTVFKNIYFLSKKKPLTSGKRHYKFIKKNFLVRKNIFLKTEIKKYKKKIGKNQYGQIVNKYHQIGLKSRYRNVIKRRLPLIHQGIVEQLEYTPNHSTLLIRIFNPIINYHFYIYHPQNVRVGFFIKTKMDENIDLNDNFNKLGDSNKIFNIIPGKPVHNINIQNYNNIACASGTFGVILQKYKNFCLVKFPSKKIFYILSSSQATLGRMSNVQYKLCNLGKAGRNRWFGKRPRVRGVAMNPIDHPHGGGQGKTSGGQPSVSPWGKPTKQIKHRKFVVFKKNKKFVKILDKKNKKYGKNKK